MPHKANMKTNTPNYTYNSIQFSGEIIANPDDFVPPGEYNPHNIRPWLILVPCGNFMFPAAVVFASDIQDALDLAVDNNKLDALQVPSKYFYEDFHNDNDNVVFLGDADEPFHLTDVDNNKLDALQVSYEDTVVFLGNADEPFDLTDVKIIPLPKSLFVTEESSKV